MLDEVGIACIAALCTYTTTVLSAEFAERSALDISEVRDSDDHFVIGIEILSVEVAGCVVDVSAAFVTVFVSDFFKFLSDNCATYLRIVED